MNEVIDIMYNIVLFTSFFIRKLVFIIVNLGKKYVDKAIVTTPR